MEAVLADVDANRRHTVCCFAGHSSCSFCLLHSSLPGCVSEHGRFIPLADFEGAGSPGMRLFARLASALGNGQGRCLEADSGAAVLAEKLDARRLQGLLDLAQAFDGSLDRAFTALHALHRRDVDAGPLRKLPRGLTQEAAGGTNLL